MSPFKLVNTWDLYERERRSLRESLDCTVSAIAVAFEWSYEKAHSHMKQKMGRRDRGCSYGFEEKLEGSLEGTGSSIETQKIKGYNRKGKIVTLRRFIESNPEGNWIILVRGHALAVKDGVIYDQVFGLRRHVQFAHRVYP